MAFVEPIIVVLGPFCGGTSAVAKVLDRLGVFMGAGFDWSYREPHDTWEDSRLSQLCRWAFTVPGAQLQVDAGSLEAKLRGWADEHRAAAHTRGRRPGVKHPLLCAAIDCMRAAWGPIVPVVVERPAKDIVASLNRLEWWADEQERADSTAYLNAARDRALAGAAAVKVDFQELRATPAVTIRRLADELGLDVTEEQIQAAVESVLQSADVRGTGSKEDSRDLLVAELERNPDDRQLVYTVAQICFDIGDFVGARKWYGRAIEMGADPEHVYTMMYRIAQSMSELDEPWPEVEDAYLRAWEFRPTRAEPLFEIAYRCRRDARYWLGYLFAKHAAEIPLPEQDTFLVRADIHLWRATDEQAVCASWIGKRAEAFTLNRRLLVRPDLPDEDRQRIARNRDLCAPTMIEAASAYPGALIKRLAAGPRGGEVVVSLLAGPDRHCVELTLNSLVNCCTDIAQVGRFVVVDVGLSAQDRAVLGERYGFLEFADRGPNEGPGSRLAYIRRQLDARFWLHLGQGWRFFAPEDLITRLTSVLDAEPEVFQVAVNFTDAVKLTGASAAEQAVRRAAGAGRYLLTNAVAHGPAMFDTARLDRTGGVQDSDADPFAELRRRADAAGLRTASLDEILCIT